MSKVREDVIERHLVNEMKKVGGIAYKFVSPGRRAVPDRLVLLPGGKVIFVECKAPGEKPRPDQLREHARLFALGHQVIVLDSKDLTGIF
ncbi:nuclease [Morganella morganii]|uniref:Nuclease n=1 Tax=Morganella morganii TaxID=582 RepID=A0A433ZXF9_MORMO|nr:VRR-NUC domain-containing protein [Morganella morganii]RUT66821.1 nuclease [Morganella morganii]